MTSNATGLLVLRDGDGNYYVRVPSEQAVELEMALGTGDVAGYAMPNYQPLFAFSTAQLSGFQVGPVAQVHAPRALNPWLA